MFMIQVYLITTQFLCLHKHIFYLFAREYIYSIGLIFWESSRDKRARDRKAMAYIDRIEKRHLSTKAGTSKDHRK